MTTITALEAFKSRQNFSEFIESQLSHPSIVSVLDSYPKKNGQVILQIAELTQSLDLFNNIISDSMIENLPHTPLLVWIVVNEKERILRLADFLNNRAKTGWIFVFKASLNDDKIAFECLLKPQIPEKKTRVVNTNTPAKQLQQEYWQAYFDKCDELQNEMQVNPAPRHYQYIGIGKKGVQIMQTINTVNNTISTELFINNDKEIFKKLYKAKDEIEKELGALDWQELEGKKSSRIRKTYEFDLTNKDLWTNATETHIKLAEEFRVVFKAFL